MRRSRLAVPWCAAVAVAGADARRVLEQQEERQRARSTATLTGALRAVPGLRRAQRQDRHDVRLDPEPGVGLAEQVVGRSSRAAPASRSSTPARTPSSPTCRSRSTAATRPTSRSSRSPACSQQMVQTGTVKKPPARHRRQRGNWNAAWKSYGSVNGTFYAAPMSANMKSLVWYSPKYFAAHNYTVPTTWADLMALSAKIAVGQQRRQAVVRRHQLRHRERLAGHRLARGSRARHLRRPGLRRLDQPQGQVQRPADQGGDEDRRQLHAEPGVGQRWLRRRQVDRDDDVPERRPADPEEQVRACCSRRRSTRRSGPRARRSARHGDVFAFYLPPVDPSIKTPVEGGGEFVTAFSDDRRDAGRAELPVQPGVGRQPDQGRAGLGLGEQKVDQSLYTDPIDKLSAKYLADPQRDVPLRRLRRHAGRGRFRRGVEGDGRLVRQRQVDRRRSPRRSTRPGRTDRPGSTVGHEPVRPVERSARGPHLSRPSRATDRPIRAASTKE